MMMIGHDPLTADHEVPQAALGSLYINALGDIFRYVKFEDAVTYKRGMLVAWTAGTPLGGCVTVDCSEALEATGITTAGVVMGTQTQNYHGYIQVGGVALVIGDGSVAAGEYVIKDPSVDTGIADTFADGEEEQVIGVALDADDTANDPLATDAMFHCRLKGLV